MKESIFIFTFSPVQSFIAEARRASDLFVGSRILVELGRPVAKVILNENGRLIYPNNLLGDIPNKIVAVIDYDRYESISEKVKQAFFKKWQEIAESTKPIFLQREPKPDNSWENIWARQVKNQWEIFFSCVVIEGKEFKECLSRVNKALEANKRTRVFFNDENSLETGYKDTLSGKRSALHTEFFDAREYWTQLSNSFHDSKIKHDGVERLDAIGSIKRFSSIATEEHFPSTSTIASSDFLKRILLANEGEQALKKYREFIEELGCFKVSSSAIWPFDGDLFYINLLTKKFFNKEYGLSSITDEQIRVVRDRLRQLIRIAGSPSPYYSLIALDGDSMGDWISSSESEQECGEISRKLDEYSSSIRSLVSGENEYCAKIIYNGGDDVMAMAPISTAIPFAIKMANVFNEKTGGRSASAGIVICHHQSPLSSAIKSAKDAESEAKKVNGKSAVCVKVIKRSGTPYSVYSHWKDLSSPYEFLVDALKKKQISSNFAYELINEAQTIGYISKEAQHATIKRLVKRHKLSNELNVDQAISALLNWRASLDWDDEEPGLIRLARWIVLTRFVAQGGTGE